MDNPILNLKCMTTQIEHCGLSNQQKGDMKSGGFGMVKEVDVVGLMLILGSYMDGEMTQSS